MQGPVSEFERYRVGDTVAPDLADRKVRNMLFLVAYDICEPKRLRRIATICEDYGIRVEKSVFECDVMPEDFDRLWAELSDTIDPADDAIVAYRICCACVERISSMGSVVRPEKHLAYVI